MTATYQAISSFPAAVPSRSAVRPTSRAAYAVFASLVLQCGAVNAFERADVLAGEPTIVAAPGYTWCLGYRRPDNSCAMVWRFDAPPDGGLVATVTTLMRNADNTPGFIKLAITLMVERRGAEYCYCLAERFPDSIAVYQTVNAAPFVTTDDVLMSLDRIQSRRVRSDGHSGDDDFDAQWACIRIQPGVRSGSSSYAIVAAGGESPQSGAMSIESGPGYWRLRVNGGENVDGDRDVSP